MQKNFSGSFHVTVDEKGRFSLPTKLYNQLAGMKTVYVTRGGNTDCLWLVTEEYWQQFVSRISSNASPFHEEELALVRYFVGHAFEQEVEEKTRRISVPQPLLTTACIKDKCLIVGLVKFFELWNPEVFQAKLEKDTAMRESQTNKLGGLVKF